jgi:hypothetical protein
MESNEPQLRLICYRLKPAPIKGTHFSRIFHAFPYRMGLGKEIHTNKLFKTMELKLPHRWSDLSLGELQVMMTSENLLERVSACSGKSVEQLRKMPQKLLEAAGEHIENLMNQETSRFEKVLELDGKRLGFIPNWDEFTAGEWIDLETYLEDFWKNAHKVMAYSIGKSPTKSEIGTRYRSTPPKKTPRYLKRCLRISYRERCFFFGLPETNYYTIFSPLCFGWRRKRSSWRKVGMVSPPLRPLRGKHPQDGCRHYPSRSSRLPTPQLLKRPSSHMITFNNIVESFEIFAENHFFIKSFSFGSPDDVDLSKFEEFPLMHLVYTGATYDAGMKTYNLEVYILDVPHDKTGR